MKDFYDTAIVAAFRENHPNHEASVRLFSKANKRDSACALHSLAEFYAVLTVLPLRPVVPPEQVLLFNAVDGFLDAMFDLGWYED